MFSNFYNSLTQATSSFITQTKDTIDKITYSGLFSGGTNDINCLREINQEPKIYSLFTNHDLVNSDELKTTISMLEEKHKGGLLVINLSPRPIMADNVISFECRGYVSVPLIITMNIVRTMKKFLSEKPLYAAVEKGGKENSHDSAIVIACKDNIQRAYIIAAVYKYLDKKGEFGFKEIMASFDMDISKYLCKSHIRYMNYVVKIQEFKKRLNAGKLKEKSILGPIVLRAVQIYNIPNLDPELFTPIVDIIQKNILIYSETKSLENCIEFPKEETFALLNLKEPVRVEGDFIVRIKIRKKNDDDSKKYKSENWIRFMVNSSMLIPYKEDVDSKSCVFSSGLDELDQIGTHITNKNTMKISLVFSKENDGDNVKEWVDMINSFNVLGSAENSKSIEDNIEAIMDELDLAESDVEDKGENKTSQVDKQTLDTENKENAIDEEEKKEEKTEKITEHKEEAIPEIIETENKEEKDSKNSINGKKDDKVTQKNEEEIKSEDKVVIEENKNSKAENKSIPEDQQIKTDNIEDLEEEFDEEIGDLDMDEEDILNEDK